MKKFNLSKGLLVGLLTLALCFTCFGMAKASASDSTTENTPTKTTADTGAQYKSATDTVESSANNGKSVVYVLKAKSGNLIKVGATSYQMTGGKISITDLGIKKTTADVYLYVCDKEVEVEAGETVSANLVIAGNANKVVGKVNYAKVDEAASVDVLSATYTNKTQKTAKEVPAANLYWSEDGEKWFLANGNTTADATNQRKLGTKNMVDGFTGEDLASKLEAGAIIYIKQTGTDGQTGEAAFGSKTVKVKIAKQAKAPKAKVDVAKDTIALKNGFDFAYAVKSSSGSSTEYTVYETWHTILPVLKTAANKETATAIVKTSEFTPLAKKDTNAGKIVTDATAGTTSYSYTAKAYKALAIDDLFDVLKADYFDKDATTGAWTTLKEEDNPLPTDYRIAIRKSATEKKPASAVTLIELAPMTEAPLVYTEDNVNGQFLVASAEEFSKKGLSFGDIAGFPGYTSTSGSDGAEVKTLATSGYDTTFKIDTSIAAASLKGKDDGSTFEYLVVDTADLFGEGDAAIDWTTAKWKKLVPSKVKITEKLAGAYSTKKGTKKKTTLKSTVSAPVEIKEGTWEKDVYGRISITDAGIKDAGIKTLLLVRRQGDKASGTRASEYIALYVVKESSKSFKLYSTVSNGEEAILYTIQFAKWSKANATSAYDWNVDESIDAVKIWVKDGDTREVAIPALTNAAYYSTVTNASSGYDLHEAVTAGSAPGSLNAGKFVISGNSGDLTDGGTTQTLIVREGANVKLAAVFSVSGSSTPVATINLTPATANGKVGSNSGMTIYVGTGSASGDKISSISGFAIPAGYKLHASYSGGATGIKIGSKSAASTIAEYGTNGAPTEITLNEAAGTAIDTAEETTVTFEYLVERWYTIKLEKNTTGSGSGKTTEQTSTSYTLPEYSSISGDLTAPDGYYLKGWATTKNATGDAVKRPGTQITLTDDVTYYPIWEAVAISLNKTATTITVEATETLTATTVPAGATVTWTSNDEDVAIVEDGVVTGVAAGTAKITASITKDGVQKKAECTVTVTAE